MKWPTYQRSLQTKVVQIDNQAHYSSLAACNATRYMTKKMSSGDKNHCLKHNHMLV
jgi:hypothetical protein